MKFLVSWFYFNSSCFSVMLLLNYKTIKKHSGGSPTICLLFVFAILSNGSGRYLKIRLKYFSSQTPGSLSFNPMIKKTNQQKDQLSLSLYLEALQPGSIINTLVCSMLYPFFTQLSLNQIPKCPHLQPHLTCAFSVLAKRSHKYQNTHANVEHSVTLAMLSWDQSSWLPFITQVVQFHSEADTPRRLLIIYTVWWDFHWNKLGRGKERYRTGK